MNHVTIELLCVSGSTRSGSVNTAVLRTAAALSPASVHSALYDDLAALPHFDPDDDGDRLPEIVGELRARIASADAMLFSTPEYAGALPGSFKNLLDWTIGGGEIYEKPVAWINASTGPTGAKDAYDSLRIVLSYVAADIVEDACVHLPVRRDAIGPDGLVDDATARAGIIAVVAALVAHVSGIEPMRTGI